MTSASPSPTMAPAPSAAEQHQSEREEPDWPLWAAPAAVALGFVVGTVATIFVAVLGHANGSSLSHPGAAVTLVGDVLFDIGFVAAAIYVANLRGRPRAADFGFRRAGLWGSVGAVLAAGLGYYVVSAIYASLFHISGREKLPSELGVGHSTAALVGAAVFVCVIAPIAEEFFFRGFIFGVLRRWKIKLAGHDLGTWLAAAVTGILFGLAHTGSASPKYLIPLGLLGFVLCLVRWRTRSLYPCMALHSINNALALGVNQLNWNAGEIVGLIAGSLLVVGALTAPLSARGAVAR